MMYRLLVLLLFIVTLDLSAFHQIRLKNTVTVSGRQVRIRDIASGYPVRMGERIVCTIPLGRFSVELDYSRLRGQLNKIIGSPVILIGSRVLVNLVRFTISEKQLIRAARPLFETAVRGDRLQIRLLGRGGFTGGAGRLLSIRTDGGLQKRSDGGWSVAFLIRTSVGVHRVRAVFAVRSQYLRWGLSRDLPAGHTLEKSDFRRFIRTVKAKRRDCSRFVGRQLARKMRKGDFPDADDIVRKTVVRAGDLVRIVYRAPGISFEFTGRAVESGKDGDRIRVRNALTGRMVAVRVGVGGHATISGGKYSE